MKSHCHYYEGDSITKTNVIVNNILMTAKCFCTIIKNNKNRVTLYHFHVIVFKHLFLHILSYIHFQMYTYICVA